MSKLEGMTPGTLRDQVAIAKQNGSRWIQVAVADVEPLLGASGVDVEGLIIEWMAANKPYWREAAKDLAHKIRKHIAQPTTKKHDNVSSASTGEEKCFGCQHEKHITWCPEHGCNCFDPKHVFSFQKQY